MTSSGDTGLDSAAREEMRADSRSSVLREEFRRLRAAADPPAPEDLLRFLTSASRIGPLPPRPPFVEYRTVRL